MSDLPHFSSPNVPTSLNFLYVLKKSKMSKKYIIAHYFLEQNISKKNTKLSLLLDKAIAPNSMVTCLKQRNNRISKNRDFNNIIQNYTSQLIFSISTKCNRAHLILHSSIINPIIRANNRSRTLVTNQSANQPKRNRNRGKEVEGPCPC